MIALTIRATFVRALVISAAVAGALAPVASLAEGAPASARAAPALPEKAARELPAALLSLLPQKKMPKLSPILIRIFKEESELEVWKQTASGHFELLKLYPVCRWSGEIGPKLHEGDYQAPEGFYAITPKLMNPNSSYYLAINMGFPNAFDAANDRDGSFLMIHGDCASVGCYAMTDEQIGEIYGLARDAFLGSQPAFQVQAYPFRMTPDNLARHRTNPNMPFWQMLKIGNDHFEATHREPKVDVCDRLYVFDARPVSGVSKPGSSTPQTSDPGEQCRAFVVDPKVAQHALDKQRADEAAYAQLVKDNIPAVPIHTGLDGSMNEVFRARFPYVFISLSKVLLDGSLELPPLQPIPYVDSHDAMTVP
jgi:murein L,D-transpeptidase YafK